eukprot:Rhum_TRINITY_DN306_c0_g2::Rhum_TRINITY_DN306_c0_g2_i1::g.1085::m.1085
MARVMAFRRGMTVMAGFAAGCGFGNAAYCKPKDVPDYLMPYYLTTLRRRFNHYASGKTLKGNRCMTSEDFVRALLCAKNTSQEIKPSVIRDLDELFRVVDANGDGLLSFAEFSLFMLFLTNSQERFELGFKMFDQNESGTVDVEEFKELCNCLSVDTTVRFSFRGGITQKFFGDDYTNQLSIAEFLNFVSSLRREVWKAEFRQFDHNERGAIRPEEFAELVTNAMLGSHLPFYIVDNIRRLKSNPKMPQEIPYSAWEVFNRLVLNSGDVARLIQTYTSSGLPLRKGEFTKAVQVVIPDIGDVKTPVDLIFAIFDRDGDGALEYDEFLSVAHSKFTFNSMHNKSKEDEDPFFERVRTCVVQSWSTAWL